MKTLTKRTPHFFIHLVLCTFALLCIFLLWSLVSVSFSEEFDMLKQGYRLIPVKLDLTGYIYVLNDPRLIFNGYKMTVTLTVLGTFISLLVTSGGAYAISRPDFRYRNKVSFFIFFTMLFNGGLIPTYILITQYLHLKDTIWVLILPHVAGAWNILLLRTFFQKMPFEIIESCYMDGAGELRIFFQFVLPLSKPGIATVGLFITLAYWNEWWMSLLYIEKNSLVPLQLLLYRIMAQINYLTSQTSMPGYVQTNEVIPKESARMAMAVLAAGPMLFIFPFFQKYLVKGLTVGSVKG